MFVDFDEEKKKRRDRPRKRREGYFCPHPEESPFYDDIENPYEKLDHWQKRLNPDYI